MRYRFMRVIVFFDLPVLTSANRREYSKFRKMLIFEGFVMMQKSVYSKITMNGSASDAVISNLRKHKPPEGVVQILIVTEKQFQGIEYLLGESQTEVVDSQQRLVVL